VAEEPSGDVMISYNTKPGTKIKCVEPDAYSALTLGKVYTLSDWRPNPDADRYPSSYERLAFLEERGVSGFAFRPTRFEVVEEQDDLT